ncbi:MAG: hypothetical protein ACP5P4_01535 [Steroidobacteraceae bacterium]
MFGGAQMRSPPRPMVFALAVGRLAGTLAVRLGRPAAAAPRRHSAGGEDRGLARGVGAGNLDRLWSHGRAQRPGRMAGHFLDHHTDAPPDGGTAIGERLTKPRDAYGVV